MSYDPFTPRVVQTDSWSCSIASTTWLLRSIGLDAGYPQPMETLMQQAGLVTPDEGLLVGTGGPLAQWLCTEYGLNAANLGSISWDWLAAVAGTRPVIVGGHGWNHWVGVRQVNGDDNLALANPADGWMGVYQILTPGDFERLGPFSAVYCAVPPEEAPVTDEQMAEVQRIAQDEVVRNIEKALAVKRLPAEAREALAYGALPAAQTLARGEV